MRNIFRESQEPLSRTPSKRTVYINEETSRKDLNTPFHSPYKDGRKNPQYTNPSFISSHLFYSPYFPKNIPEVAQVIQNQVLTPNQLRKQQLYHQRMATEAHSRSINKERKRQFNQKYSPSHRVSRSNHPQQMLQNDLDNLKHYKQEKQNRNRKKKQIYRKLFQEPEEPIYLEKAFRKQSSVSPLKKSYQKGQEKRYFRADEELYRINLDRLIQKNHELLLQQERKEQRQREMLSDILKEQISAKALNDKKWNY